MPLSTEQALESAIGGQDAGLDEAVDAEGGVARLHHLAAGDHCQRLPLHRFIIVAGATQTAAYASTEDFEWGL